MAESPSYESPIPWDGSRPSAAVIMCVDGRWRLHVQKFATFHLKADSHYDIVAVPGGIEPLTLQDFVPKDFNFLHRRIESLVAAHGTRRIVAVAHQDCAWYMERRIGGWRGDVRERQISDLRRAAAVLRERFAGIAVETYFARLMGPAPERVIFDLV